MTRYILGIDPGKTGALALLDPVRSILEVIDIPLEATEKGKTIIQWPEVARLIDARASEIGHCFFERVGVRPGEGAVGAFQFGFTNGCLYGIVCSNHIPLTFVTPQSWKKWCAIGAGKNKDASRSRAGELFPRYAHLFQLKKHDGRAEAALIAGYGAQKLQPTPERK